MYLLTTPGMTPCLLCPRPSCAAVLLPKVTMCPASVRQAACSGPSDTEMIFCLTAFSLVGTRACFTSPASRILFSGGSSVLFSRRFHKGKHKGLLRAP